MCGLAIGTLGVGILIKLSSQGNPEGFNILL